MEIDLGDKESWDDSALVKHWEDSFAEYKNADKSSAKKVEQDQKDEKDNADGDGNELNAEPEEDVDEPLGEEMVEDNMDVGRDTAEEAQQAVELSEHEPAKKVMENTESGPGLISLDNLEPGVKQLVMSWYWAGYYHGLEVGKSGRDSNER